VLLKPGTFFIFFAGEAHRPGAKVDETVPVKKMVIKVRE
jgi:YhcH/YjgK/YiaL family protein